MIKEMYYGAVTNMRTSGGIAIEFLIKDHHYVYIFLMNGLNLRESTLVYAFY